MHCLLLKGKLLISNYLWLSSPFITKAGLTIRVGCTSNCCMLCVPGTDGTFSNVGPLKICQRELNTALDRLSSEDT